MATKMDPKLIISILIKGKAKGDLTTVGDAAEARGWSDERAVSQEMPLEKARKWIIPEASGRNRAAPTP